MNFSHFVEVDKINKVKIINDSLSFTLSEDQLATFKKDIYSLELAPDTSFENSSTRILIRIDGKEYEVSSSENGKHFEVSRELATKNKTDLKTFFF